MSVYTRTFCLSLRGRPGPPKCASIIHVPDRHSSSSSTPVRKPLSKLDLSQIKRGTGGRSSFSGIVATVFGASGYLGQYVTNRLGRLGSQIIVPYRGDYYDSYRLKLCGDLGQVLFHPFDLNNEESLYKVMKYSNVVVNVIGKDYETSNWKFSDVHVEGARKIARIAKDCGVEKLIHVSALNCAEHPKPVILKKGSQFLSSKWHGEQALKDEFPNAVIIRPSDMFGSEDRFLLYYSNVGRRRSMISYTIPLWNKGKGVIKQPVFVGDVAQGIINAILDPVVVGQTFEAVGPNRHHLADIVDYIFRSTNKHNNFKISNMKYNPVIMLKTSAMEKIRKYSLLSWERFEREHVTDTTTGLSSLEDLGVKLTAMEDVADYILKIMRYATYDIDPYTPHEETTPPPVAQ